MECGIEGALLDLERVARDLLDSLRNGIAVNGSKRNDPHDEKVERALRKVKAVVWFLNAYAFYIYIARCRRSRYTRRFHACGAASERRKRVCLVADTRSAARQV